ncbi:hypothetical protein BO85DRAFT_437064 [Aspergillus piperis CBS 112811]|uniref:Uncharacterized protein n=1 Tax=Aspergillus piperis CBS 112811 TaxID=1448313 RepID=A0A8G1VML3_9EURO|nr:hypothetical protein BO85DRAFT_437064 [Aspergillus piperis CBS 112811]RAH58969.1 hypothetical protein BO85DRAFT_437064 [Aspergillus piperis CBS 112811]
MVPAHSTVGSLWDGGIDMEKPSTENLYFWGQRILTASSFNRGTSSTLVRLLHIPQLASERGGYRGRILKHCIFQAKPQTPDTESCFHGARLTGSIRKPQGPPALQGPYEEISRRTALLSRQGGSSLPSAKDIVLTIIAMSSCPGKKGLEWEKIRAHSVSKEDGVEVKERYDVGIAVLPSRQNATNVSLFDVRLQALQKQPDSSSDFCKGQRGRMRNWSIPLRTEELYDPLHSLEMSAGSLSELCMSTSDNSAVEQIYEETHAHLPV